MTETNGNEDRAQFLISTRAPARPLAVVTARSAAEACRRVVAHLSGELAVPGNIRSLRAERYRSSTLPRHLPVYAEEYFIDPPWHVH